MNDIELPPDVRKLLNECVPSVDALEALMLLIAGREHRLTASDIAAAVRPPRIPESQIREYLLSFQTHGIVTEVSGAGFGYEPRSPEIAETIDRLVTAYNQRPVTLIRTIYALADVRKIRSLADAFKIVKDE